MIRTTRRSRSARPTRSNRLVALAAAAALTVSLAACGSDTSDGAAEAETLRVGQLGSADTIAALFELAGEDDTDYEIETSIFAAGPALLEAVPSDSVDVGLMADTPTIFATVSKLPLKAVAVGSTMTEGESTVNVYASKKSGLTDLSQLKGKKIATTEATILQYTLVKALEKAGLKYSDVEIVNLAPADGLAAFNAGDVDALTALDPQSAQLAASGAVKIGDGAGLTSNHFYISATEKALADEATSENIGDFIERFHRARAWANANKEEWAAKYAEINGLDIEIARAVVAREEYTPIAIDASVKGLLQEQADVYTELGLLPAKVDVSNSFDDRYNALIQGK